MKINVPKFFEIVKKLKYLYDIKFCLQSLGHIFYITYRFSHTFLNFFMIFTHVHYLKSSHDRCHLNMIPAFKIVWFLKLGIYMFVLIGFYYVEASEPKWVNPDLAYLCSDASIYNSNTRDMSDMPYMSKD